MKTPIFSRWASPILLILIGFGLRLYRLGAQSLWYDETVSALLAQKSVSELIAHTARDIHPPGYYLLLQGWTRLAGDSEFALAYFSLGFSLLLIAAVVPFCRLLFSGEKVGLWAAALMALAPYNLWYAQEVRMYSLGAFLGLMTAYFALQATATESHGRRGWLAYAAFAAWGLYTLYYFAFLLIALNLFLLGWMLWALRGSRTPRTARRLGPWVAANLGVVTLYLPWLPIAWRQATDPPVPPWRSEVPLSLIGLETWSALSLGESVAPLSVWPILLLTAGLFGLGLYHVQRGAWRVLLPTLTFGPLLLILLIPVATGAPLYHVRYVYTYSPAFYVLLAAGLAWLWQRQRLIAVAGCVALLLGAGRSIYQLHTAPLYASDDFRGAVQFIEQHWQPGDVVLINAGYAYTTFAYYFSQPVSKYQRLMSFTPDVGWRTAPHPLVLETGTVGGPASLGWGDPRSDFYAMSPAETRQALSAVNQTFNRLWMLRAYDTVTDPEGLIRTWLNAEMRPFEDRLFAGPSNIRVQGFLSPSQPPPPVPSEAVFEEMFRLHGFAPPDTQYRAGQTVYVATWWEALSNPPETPRAISLKLWNAAGELAAQHDMWPIGSLYFTPNWEPGHVVRHPMKFRLPPELSPGQYWLDVQLYDTVSGQPLTLDDGAQTVVTLSGLTVIP